MDEMKRDFLRLETQLRAERDDARDELEAVKSKLESLTLRSEHDQHVIDGLMAELIALKAERDKLKAELYGLRGSNTAEFKSERDKLKAGLKKTEDAWSIRSEYDQTVIDGLIAERNKLISELEEVASERDKLSAQLMQQSIEMCKLFDSIFILTRTNADLLARLR